jgi:hypothetical protein
MERRNVEASDYDMFQPPLKNGSTYIFLMNEVYKETIISCLYFGSL